ncbi:peptide chain release factor N(5)-glutamine methyltransferase [Sulfurovum sp.]|uniref:peptide chain release factor N(5)-glutamine methyltransferase n=2 Tax=Sulfurovum sp. TaxID=1969726 RepID=UPI0025E1B9DC|nr:peptide chain release factor N(5)-glutamine methyltransferase [Sulfurovum sp.]
MTVRQILPWAQERLKISCERPQFEAELLLAYHMKKDRTYLMLHDNDEVKNIETFKDLISRRAAHEPYEYIVGEVSFYDTYLYTAPNVLIARPETEILVEQAARIIEREKMTKVIEVGVGSGAIAVMLARKFPDLQIVATDISEDALALARRNIARHGVEDQITLKKTSVIDGVQLDAEMVVSNPPYIAADFLLEENVFSYEPHTALFGGDRGDELLKQIVLDVKEKEIKWLACEMGYDQKESIASFVKEIGVQSVEFYKDFSGLDRGFIIEFI